MGGGTVGEGLEVFYAENKRFITSIDLYNSDHVDCIMDAHHLFFDDDQFDLVIVQAVLEHVVFPEKVVSEIHRVLKSKGYVYAEVPFLQNVHEGAYDFTRYTRNGLLVLMRPFKLVFLGSVKGPGHAFAWSIRALFQPILPKSLATLLTLPVFLLGRILDYFIEKNNESDSAACYYLLGQKEPTYIPMNARQIIKFYLKDCAPTSRYGLPALKDDY